MHIRTYHLSLKANQRKVQKLTCRDPAINPVQSVQIFDSDLKNWGYYNEDSVDFSQHGTD
jgi:hypothetical protein